MLPSKLELALRDAWLAESGLMGSAGGCPVSFNLGGVAFDPDDGSWVATQRSSAPDRYSVAYRHLTATLRLDVEARKLDGASAVEWVSRFTNTGTADTPIISDWHSGSVALPAPEAQSRIRYSLGSLGTIDDFAPRSTVLAAGEHQRFSPGGGRSSSEVLPFFSVDGGQGCVVLAVGWSGEWAVTISHEEHVTRIHAGLDHTSFVLEPGETVRGPRVCLLFSESNEPSQATNLFRQCVLQHYSPRSSGELSVPALSALTWGSTPPSVHTKLMDQIREERLPFEQYWIDAGWFGRSTDWWKEVGDWSPNSTIWPNGFSETFAHARSHGLDTVLWFEPERVAQGSRWYREKPEWLLRIPESERVEWERSPDKPHWVWHESRRTEMEPGDLLFDLGHPEARSYLVDFVSSAIDEAGLDVYRHDFNFAPLSFWRANDTPTRQGMTELKYVSGLYDFFDELRRRHPRLRIDSCASGGRRLDIELLGRASVLCRSDWVTDPVAHQCHTMGLSEWLPMQAAVSVAGYDSYSIRSAATTGLSLSWTSEFGQPEPGVLDLDFDGIRSALAEVVSLRDVLLGDFHPLTPYSTSRSVWMAWEYAAPDGSEGAATVFRREESPSAREPLRLRGLDPEATYRIEADVALEPPFSSGGVHRGSDLMEQLHVDLPEAPSSAVIRYRRCTPSESVIIVGPGGDSDRQHDHIHTDRKN